MKKILSLICLMLISVSIVYAYTNAVDTTFTGTVSFNRIGNIIFSDGTENMSSETFSFAANRTLKILDYNSQIAADALLDDTTGLLDVNTVDSDQYVDGSIDAVHLSPDASTKDTGWIITDTGTALAVADGLQGFVVPSSWVGMNITSVIAVVDTAGTTGTTDFQVRRVRAGLAVDVLSTVATIDTTELTSEDAATPYVINAANDDLALGDKIFIDVDAISTTPPQGGSFTIEGQLP